MKNVLRDIRTLNHEVQMNDGALLRASTKALLRIIESLAMHLANVESIVTTNTAKIDTMKTTKTK